MFIGTPFANFFIHFADLEHERFYLLLRVACGVQQQEQPQHRQQKVQRPRREKKRQR